MNANSKRWVVTFAASLVIHAVFCIQAVSAALAGTGGLVTNDFFMIAFLPHNLAMYFLPPTWPIINGEEIDWWRVSGKLAVSYPASLLYGWLVGAGWQLVHCLRRRVGGKDTE
jgi:hypothetical protein